MSAKATARVRPRCAPLSFACGSWRRDLDFIGNYLVRIAVPRVLVRGSVQLGKTSLIRPGSRGEQIARRGFDDELISNHPTGHDASPLGLSERQDPTGAITLKDDHLFGGVRGAGNMSARRVMAHGPYPRCNETSTDILPIQDKPATHRDARLSLMGEPFPEQFFFVLQFL